MDHKEELMRLKAREKRFRDEAEAKIARLEAEIASLKTEIQEIRANTTPNSEVEDLRNSLAALKTENGRLKSSGESIGEKYDPIMDILTFWSAKR